MIPVHSQWNITESVVITMSRKCQLLMGYCSKGPGHSNTDRIERFQIEATSSSLKVPFSSIRYRLQLLAEGKRELYRYRGDESAHASSMWTGNGVVVCTNRECQFSSKKNALDPSNRCHGISGYKTSSRHNPFTFHVNSSLPELSQFDEYYWQLTWIDDKTP